MNRLALRALLGFNLGLLAVAAAAVLWRFGAWDFFFDPDLRLALYVGALLVLFLVVSLTLGFARPRTAP